MTEATNESESVLEEIYHVNQRNAEENDVPPGSHRRTALHILPGARPAPASQPM